MRQIEDLLRFEGETTQTQMIVSESNKNGAKRTCTCSITLPDPK